MISLKQILLVIITLFFFTCKEKEDKMSLSGDNQKNKLTLKFEIKTKQDLRIKLYYCLDSIITFNESKSIIKEVEESDVMKELVFEIDEKTIPRKIKLVFESEDAESNIVVGNTFVDYGEKSFIIKPKAFWYNFNPSQNIDYSKVSSEFKLLDDKTKSTPHFISRKIFDESLLNLANPKTENKPKELLKDDTFRIFIDGVIKNNSTSNLYYYDQNNTQLLISEKIKGKNSEQRITFELPSKRIPKTFKIEFKAEGNNDVSLKRIVLNYNTDRIVVNDTAIAVYFDIGKYLYFQPKTKHIISNNVKNDITIESKKSLEQRINNRYLDNK